MMKKRFIKRLLAVGLAVSLVNSGFSSPIADTGLLGNVSAFADEINDEEPVETAGEGVVTEPSADEEIEVPSIPEPEDEKGSVSEDEAEGTLGGSTVSDDEAVEETVSRNDTEEPAGDNTVTVNGHTYDVSNALVGTGIPTDISYNRDGSIMYYNLPDQKILLVSGSGKMKDGNIIASNYYNDGKLVKLNYTDYEIIIDDRISYIGNGFYDYASSGRPHCSSLPSSLTAIGSSAFYYVDFKGMQSMPSGLTEIGKNAFRTADLSSLQSMPSGITEIKDYTFAGADLSSLRSLPSSLTTIDEYAFSSAKIQSLTELPDSLETIGRSAFSSSSIALTKYPAGLTYIGKSAFEFCSKLPQANLSSNVRFIGDNAFRQSGIERASIPEGITYIGKMTFDACGKLAEVSTPTTLKSISGNAFDGCGGLTSITLHEGLETIGEKAFYECQKLSITSLPNSVTTIGDFAFFYCFKLALTSLPDSLTSIGESAFENCLCITAKYIPSGVTVIKDKAFMGCEELALESISGNVMTSIGEYAFWNCKKITLTSLPDSVTAIGNSAFVGCDNLALTSLPSSLKTVGGSAFEGCKNITLTSLPDGITTIGGSAFFNCEKMALTSLPNDLKSIGNYAFSNCKNLAITTLPSGVTHIYEYAFYGCKNIQTIIYEGNSLIHVGEYAFYVSEEMDTYLKTDCQPLLQYNWIGSNRKMTLISSTPASFDLSKNQDGSLMAYWYENEKVLFLTGSGKMADYDNWKPCPLIGAGIDKKEFELIIDDNVTDIGQRCFYEFRYMKGRSIPDSVASIGKEAFYGCNNISFTSLPSKITIVKQSTFDWCPKLALTSIPEGITVIESSAFSGCESITLTKLPDGLKTIGSGAFAGCYNLAITAIPDGIEVIPYQAFIKCYSLQSIKLPSSLKTIESRAFEDCWHLDEIQYYGTGLETVGDSAFEGFAQSSILWEGSQVLLLDTDNDILRQALLDTDYRDEDLIVDADQKDVLTYTILFDLGDEYHGGNESVKYLKRIYFLKDKNVSFHERSGEIGWTDRPDGHVKYQVHEQYKNILSPGQTPITLYPVWAYNGTYKVDFYGNGASGSMYDQLVPVGVSTPLNKNLYKKQGYVFKGWATTKDGSVVYADEQEIKDIAEKDKTITLCAVWEEGQPDIDTYNIVFHSNYESDATSTQVAVCGESVSLKSNPFIRESGYTFKGWATTQNGAVVYTNGQTVKDLAGKDESVHLYAVWIEPDSYIIKFHSNFGVDETTQQLVLCGKSTILTANKFVRGQNYTFEGWSLTQDGDVAYADEATVKDLAEKDQVKHLYAVWTRPDSYDIEFHSNFGTEKTYVQSVECGKTVSLSENSFVRKDGYIFKGWSLTQDGDVAYEDKAAVTDLAGKDETVPLYAVWKMEADEVIDLSKAKDGSVVAYWYEDEAKLFVTGAGEMDDWGWNEDASPIVKRFSEKQFELFMDDNVTNIGKWLFYKCKKMTCKSLPNSILTIRTGAFCDCDSLALTSLPDGVTRIELEAFMACNNLALTSLPSKLKVIERKSFESCPNLALTSLPDGVTSIESEAFMSCKNLALTSLPSKLKVIENRSFDQCPNLALTSLPDGVTRIEDRAFYDCGNLALTSLPSGVTSIGESAFSYCTNLALTSLPDGVTSIGKLAFENCYNITKIQYNGNKLTEIGEKAFFSDKPINTVLITDNEVLKNYDWAGSNRILVSEEEPVSSGTYTVKFDSNGGEGSMADQTIKCNEQTALNNNQFTRKNYNFYGWATEPDGDIVYRDAEKIYKNSDFSGKTITLYALWDIFGEIPLPEPEPEPIPRATIHCSKNVYVSDKEGKAVCDAIIGDELTINYSPEFKEACGFKQWNIIGAVPKDKTETTTTITVNSFEVWINYDREINIEYKNETPPPADSTPVKKLTFKYKKVNLAVGGEVSNAATPTYISDTPDVIYTTSNSNVVCVTPSGNFIGINTGTATVTAYCGNKKVTCEVTVYSYPSKLGIGARWGASQSSGNGTINTLCIADGEIFDVTGDTITMYSGEQAFLKANPYPYDITVPHTVKWVSGNKKAVTVENGLITAKEVTEKTNARITVTMKYTNPASKKKEQISQFVDIVVNPSKTPANKAGDKGCALALKKSSVKLQLNVAQKDSCELGITVSPKKGGNVADKEINYVSTNPNIVRVSKSKEFSINSKGKGTASIKLTAKNPGSAYVLIGTVDKNDPTKVNYKKCKVTVTNPVSEISITDDARGLLKDASSKMPNITIRKGEWDTLNAKISPDFSTDVSKIKWSASGGVTVNNGRIFAKKVTKSGKPAKVTAKCGKKKVTVYVTVTK